VFASAALVFLVEPMVGRLVLPYLGGTPAVWNTSLAFFQVALLVGYAYAHGLQRVRSIRGQALIHGAVLIAAAAVLPLRLSHALGQPGAMAPALWLVGVLALTIGPPFAALSATAPLVQAWYARSRGGAANPYVLYAASNLGSLLALLAYPVIVEPTLRLATQTLGWSLGYAAFVLVMMAVGAIAVRAPPAATETAATSDLTPPISWRRGLTWVGLAAAPSSLMLGVTNAITTDIASAPFLWVGPLALYLASFIIAFQSGPLISPRTALPVQAGAVVLFFVVLGTGRLFPLPLVALLYLAAFFLTALICHQSLAGRRPTPQRLTEFYLLVSLGGVIGGAFNAFVAPLIFRTVLEFPLVMLLACLARPWGQAALTRSQIVWLTLGLVGAGVTLAVHRAFGPSLLLPQIAVTMVSAWLLRERAWAFLALCLALTLSSQQLLTAPPAQRIERGFFGVLKLSGELDPVLGPTHVLRNGTTLHGAQAQNPTQNCRPLVYYARTTPIGQAFGALQSRKPAMRIGAIGMGAGTVATYVRPTDSLRFFEINPQVVAMATDPTAYIRRCARGPIDWVIGDARLTLAREPANSFDLLLMDAFSSDSVPSHLLTVEAMRGYLARIRPDGVIVFHLSNRNLELASPVAATARAAGGAAIQQTYRTHALGWIDAGEQAVIVARDPASLAPFSGDPRWTSAEPHGVRAWTDDYTNIFGALVRKLAG
jgi:predicted O-methyltransferase YrrM